LDITRFASSLTDRYGKFRSFTFGLAPEERYTSNWDWRCFMATMLVCNTRETSMLAVTSKLFKAFPDQEALLSLEEDKELQSSWKKTMDKHDLRHSARKLKCIIEATRTIQDKYKGKVPKSRSALQSMKGVGRHVSSVTMAWVHQEAEFGIDVHVRRIMTRWGYVDDTMDEIAVEQRVKAIIPEKQIGHFSRAFVDHGQQVCGYTPDCSNCFLKSSCPTAAKYLDW
jgi:endonuclease-3